MRQTLFHIPPEIAGQPLFGLGIAFWVWLLFALVVVFLSWQKHGWNGETLGHIPVFAIVALAIVFVLPKVEDHVAVQDGTVNKGLPIRGYGVMVLLAVVCGVGLAIYRLGKRSISSETVMNLAFAMFISGIIGARLFYVIQYWEHFQADSLRQTLINMFSFTEGGLVVYGSLVGAVFGFVYSCRRQILPLLPIADLIAPSLALGLAIGRIGCLMNGCCFGGVCNHAWAIEFPQDSPPYDHQKSVGMFHGIQIAKSPQGVMIEKIVSDEILGDTQIAVGDLIETINGKSIMTFEDAENRLLMSGTDVEIRVHGGRQGLLAPKSLPSKSLPVHPTQIYSTLNGLLLCFIGLTLYPYIKRDGQVIATVLTLYAITRFLIEIIRNDESRFLAGLTISQNVSVLMGVILLVLWLYIMSNRRPRFASWAASSTVSNRK